ncbi:hypothetical protein BN126310031 [Stenotrophomonas maltophilia]|nr:hypothetical protein BN126310031 [Stenotrophomonas maltophilia]
MAEAGLQPVPEAVAAEEGFATGKSVLELWTAEPRNGNNPHQRRGLGRREFSIMDAEQLRLPGRVDDSGSLSA